jgi:carbon-monoxide dehydrogenase large subunit
MRIDGPDKVTGGARYAGDITRPGMLWATVVRSPHPHARIVSIDTSRARALPGVCAVLTAADLPDVRVGRVMRDLPVLAIDRVRFVGEKVAAVAAEDREVAERACALIDVEYEELAAVFDPIDAMAAGAPLLHGDTDERFVSTARRAQVRNGISHALWGASLDEVEATLATADRVFEHEFRFPLQHQGYIEPHACVVETGADGKVDVWASQKAPFLLRDYFRLGLGLRDEDVEVHLVPVGGDFGGKGSIMDAGLAYFLSKATRRPVKIVMRYAEELEAGNPRHFGTSVVRTGVNADGSLVARHVRHVFASGAYAAMKPQPDLNLPAARHATGPYRMVQGCVESLMVYTNTVHGGHMRSPGGAQAAFVSEVQLDEIARALGIDRLEFRLRNAPKSGDPKAVGGVFHDSRAREVLEAAAKAIDWHGPRRPFVGKGIALEEHGLSLWAYSAEVGVYRDGRIVLRTPTPEVGVGSHNVFRQLLARELTVNDESIAVVASMVDMPYDRGVGGSRSTRLSGGAVQTAGRRVLERLKQAVAAEFHVDPANIILDKGRLRLPGGERVSLSEAAAVAGGSVVEQCTYDGSGDPPVEAWSAQAAEVEVDPETGQVRVLHLVSAHGVGEILNPVLHQGQISGAIVQGFGSAIMEQLRLENGRVLDPHLGGYKLPTIADTPRLTTVLLPPEGTVDIKPIGEGPNCGVLAAIANAVADVTGVCPATYPFDPEQVLGVLRARARQDAVV